MATVRYEYRSKLPSGKISLRLRHNKTLSKGKYKNYQAEINTPYEVNKFDFDNQTINTEIKRHLEDSVKYILNAFKVKRSDDFVPDKKWLQTVYDEFCNDGRKQILSTKFTYWIEEKIKELTLTGASRNRIKAFKTYKGIINKYDAHLEIQELDINKLNNLNTYLLNERKYALSTTNRLLKDVLLIGKYAKKNGATLPESFYDFEYLKPSKSQQGKEKLKPITLTVEEIDAIVKLELSQNYLINARKWMILAIYTAQRGEDAINYIIKENFRDTPKGLFIEFTQDKTGTQMYIPALPRVEEIYRADELPHPISTVNFNKYAKKICKLAKIDNIIKHKKQSTTIIQGEKVLRTKIAERPKYDYIASHGFRRTFCTIHYSQGLPIEEIMKVSGHKTISEFLKYIGEVEFDHSKLLELYN